MNRNWSNTTLVAYSLLPKIVNDIDFCIKTRIKSSFQSRHLRSGISNEQLFEEIINLNEKKRKAINLRFIVNTALEKVKTNDRYILYLRIVQRKTFQEISNIQNISLRTAFRRFDKAEIEYEAVLKNIGYTEEWLENEYGNEPFIAEIYKRIVNEKYFVAKAM